MSLFRNLSIGIGQAYHVVSLQQRVWQAVLILLCLLLLAPILAVVMSAIGDTSGLLRHLISTVLPTYVTTTLSLMAAVGVIALLFGVTTAWIVSRYQFSGKKVIEWMLVLPAAIPAYIIAYCYTDFLEYAGPLQTGLRALFGWQTSRDYWFPEIRSFGGAALMMASVLYPYVYLLARTAFRQTSRDLFEMTALSGRNMFVYAALPLARPAIVAGLSLVLMEVVSDFGTVEFFALETLTLGIFNVWLGMNNITAAAQLAVFAFILIGGLLMIEVFARSRASFRHGGSGRHGVPVIRLSGRKAVLCILLCSVPIIIGFAGPFSILLSFVIDDVMRGFQIAQAANIGRLAANSLLLAAVVAGLILVLSVIIGLIATYQSGRFGRILSAASATGYAFPGTILALGVLGFTGYCDGLFQTAFSTTLFAGGFLVLMLGLIVRFQAVGFGAVMSGLERMPPHMMESGRILGHGFSKSVRSVIFPLLRSSVLVGGLLVFVDILKELPMTLILRPFSFETFSTFTYQYAKEEMLEQAAMPALFIVLAGLVPVMIANSALRAGTSNV